MDLDLQVEMVSNRNKQRRGIWVEVHLDTNTCPNSKQWFVK